MRSIIFLLISAGSILSNSRYQSANMYFSTRMDESASMIISASIIGAFVALFSFAIWYNQRLKKQNRKKMSVLFSTTHVSKSPFKTTNKTSARP